MLSAATTTEKSPFLASTFVATVEVAFFCSRFSLSISASRCLVSSIVLAPAKLYFVQMLTRVYSGHMNYPRAKDPWVSSFIEP